jgi:hypothetical protein
MTKKLIVLIGIVTVALTLTAPANIITAINPADAQWQQMVLPNRDGTPFWDNASWEGDRAVGSTQGGANIGYYLTGNFGFYSEGIADSHTIFTPGGLSSALNQNAADWQYLTTQSAPFSTAPGVTGAASFYLPAGHTYTFTYLGGVAAMQNSIFGWFPLSNPSNLNPLFTNLNVTNPVQSVMATEAIGVYFAPGWYTNIWRSTDAPGQTFYEPNLGQTMTAPGFAVFEKTNGAAENWGQALIGVEDLWRQSNGYYGPSITADNDYNDAIFGLKWELNTVPEPSTWAMLGVSIAIGAVMIRKRQRRRARLEKANSKGYYFGLPR